MKPPSGVMRESPFLAAQTAPVAASAVTTIDRNFVHVEQPAVLADAALMVEHRAARREPDASATRSSTGNNTTRAVAAKQTSMALDDG